MYYHAMTKAKNVTQLYRAFLSLETEKEVADFCYDLMTPQEVEIFEGRLAAAYLLDQGKPQRTVSEETGVSIATVTRVNRFLTRGANGYRQVLDKIDNLHHSRTSGLASAS